MSNNSMTGGYLAPSSSTGLPGGLSLTQFIQTVLVGISGFSGRLVRPKYQPNPPKEPDLPVNWLAFQIQVVSPDANAYVGMNVDENTILQRHEDLEIQGSMYGPDCIENMSVLRDGFQIQQNLEALTLANMGFTGFTQGNRTAELVNERWIDRMEFSIFIKREIQRVYPIVSLVSASGTIHTVLGSEEYLIDWQTN